MGFVCVCVSCVFLFLLFFVVFVCFSRLFSKERRQKKKVWSWLSGDLGKAGKGETTQDMLYEKIFSIKNV